jgi:hypothetical protein
MIKNLTLCLAITALFLEAAADPGDTTIVQTFTFEEQLEQPGQYKSPGRRWFQFPEDDGTTYRKILMYHTLKCFEGGLTAGGLGFPCGEWDYLTYNYLFDHTGELDSTFLTHPLFLLNQQTFDETSFSTEPGVHVTRYTFDSVTESIATNVSVTTVGANEVASSLALRTDLRRHRTQFMYTVDELLGFGLTAGWIGEVALHIGNQVHEGGLLELRMGHAASAELSTWSAANLQSVYTGTFNPSPNSEYALTLNTPFQWDGEAPLVFELLYTAIEEGDTTEIIGNQGPSVTVASAESDRYIDFNGNGFVSVPPAAFEALTDEVTVTLWVKGDPGVQPANQYCFEGRNASNQRVINSHLPWGNGRVYWDAGQSGGYDRIDKQAAPNQYAGGWNHWAFTKNATEGSMHIYLNGELWHSGTGLNRTMEGITQFVIGSAAAISNFYNGAIDDFMVFKRALDQETIADYLTQQVNEAHPAFDDLLVYYTFNEPDGEPVADYSGHGHHGTVIGQVGRKLYAAEQLFLRETPLTFRPMLTLSTGEFQVTTSVESFNEPWFAVPASLATYTIENNQAIIAQIEYVWPEGESYFVFDSEGNVLETLENDLVYTDLVNATLEYYSPPFEVVDRYEIGRFITPYGIGLDLGSDGWTWVFDVTDYAPLLRGMVELEAGNWQELLDLKFIFIEGTPPREVKRVDAFWKGQYNLNTFDELVTAHTFTPNDDEVTFRLKTRSSGHGFGQGNNCAEFCQNMHSVKVNGATQWSWEIIEECADNPLYPQGGTWIYDRAGWCPGAKVTTRDFELSPLVDNQASFTVDYDVTWDPHGNYRMEGQIIAYGPHHFNHDVEIDEVLAPSQWKIHRRINPICNNPIVRIRNNGAETLTSCTLTFDVNGEQETMQWEGNLNFGETENVVLTASNEALWLGDGSDALLFTVAVSNPNGQTDEDPSNNTATSSFNRPPVYSYPNLDDNRLLIWVTTNTTPWQNRSVLEDMNGNTVFERQYEQPNFAYRDTIAINDGCYTYRLFDSADNGLNFFANNEGNGSARLRRVAGSLIDFNPNFGKSIDHTFYFKTNLVSVPNVEQPAPEVTLYPNPGNDWFTLRVVNGRSQMVCTVYDLTGRMVYQSNLNGVKTGERIEMVVPASPWAPGLYQVVVSDSEMRTTKPWVKH